MDRDQKSTLSKLASQPLLELEIRVTKLLTKSFLLNYFNHLLCVSLHILSSDLPDVLQGLSIEHISEFLRLVLKTASLCSIRVRVSLPFLLILEHFWVLNDCAGKL